VELLEDLVGRGLDAPFVLDGSRALNAAVTRAWGTNAEIQGCQVHKRRNVKAHLTEKRWPELNRRLSERIEGPTMRPPRRRWKGRRGGSTG
jgi:transposase-like protein